MSELLSQEEIDALLKGGDSGVDEKKGTNTYLTEEEIDALGEIGNISMGTAASTLFTLLNHKVTITTPDVTITSLNEIAMQYSMPFVAVEIQYTKGLEGNNLLIITEEDVKIITDLLMGGDGRNIDGELTELELSAISEVMNQMIGSSATSLASMFGKDIGISPPNAFIMDFANRAPNFVFETDEQIVKINFKMEILGILDSYIMLLIPIDFAKNMVYTLMGGQLKGKDNNGVRLGSKNEDKVIQPPNMPGQDYETESKTVSNQKSLKHHGTVGVQPVYFQPLAEAPVNMESTNIDLILDVPLQISVELGRTRKMIQEILGLNIGSVIELDRMAGESVDILVNGKIIAKGEVVVIDDNFGVRITDIVNPQTRISHIR